MKSKINLTKHNVRHLKTWFSVALFFIFSTNFILGQEIVPFGLDGMKVNNIKHYNGYLFAATDSGVYRKYLLSFDSSWQHIGLENKKINVVYPHDVGAVGWTITAGVSPTFTPNDSALIYCYCDGNWTIADTGIDRSALTSINSMDGFPSPVICGETFAGGHGKVYRRQFNTWYEEIFNVGGFYLLNIIKTDLSTNNVWIGGETGPFQPFIAKSTDLGDTWDIAYPDLGGDNACNSIEFDPADTNIIYAGMEGAVIKSTDVGQTWNLTGLNNTPFYFYGLTFDNNGDRLYAGGITNSYDFGLYYSDNSGVSWEEVIIFDDYTGILSMVVGPTPVQDINTIYLSTYADGVLWNHPVLPGVDDDKNLLKDFSLSQNYPNPFNPVTKIKYSIPRTVSPLPGGARGGLVTLKVYDVLGREVATLVNEEKQPGVYEVEFKSSVGNRQLASGIYYYQLKAGSFVETKKMILLK